MHGSAAGKFYIRVKSENAASPASHLITKKILTKGIKNTNKKRDHEIETDLVFLFEFIGWIAIMLVMQ